MGICLFVHSFVFLKKRSSILDTFVCSFGNKLNFIFQCSFCEGLNMIFYCGKFSPFFEKYFETKYYVSNSMFFGKKIHQEMKNKFQRFTKKSP